MATMRSAMQEYLDVKTANETGFTVAQVRTINALESLADRGDDGPILSVERMSFGLARVETEQDGWHHFGTVLRNGEVNWR